METKKFDYHHYVGDETFLRDYNAYQKKYAGQIRESDKVLIQLVREIAERSGSLEERFRLLDIGCSTGNLLLHLKHAFPSMELTGGSWLNHH